MANRSGPIIPHIDQFAEFLTGEGYASQTVKTKCALAVDLGQWIARHGLTLTKLDEEKLQQFHGPRRRASRRGDRFTGDQLLMFLRDRGLTPVLHPAIDRSTMGQLARDYERFLSCERGLARATVDGYLPIVQRFLNEHFQNKIVRLRDLTPRDLHRFIVREGQRVGRRHTQLTVTALRSFLRFLHQRGKTKTDLAGALLGVADWRLSDIPKFLPPAEVERVLKSCDRSTPSGQRDYAILLLLARLGLRGGEVLAMTLDDLDWERGEVLVRGKGQRVERLPLPQEVGKALVHYLRHVRPTCSTRKVFIRLKAPWHALRLSAICCVVRRALKRAGLSPAFKGAHLFRHSLATQMLRRGASLGEIGQLLRHRQPTTTQIYAKVDIEVLRGIALPWMGGAA